MKKLLLIPLTALLVMMMFATSFATSGTAHAAQVSGSQVYSIQFVDTNTGKVTSWSTTSFTAWQTRLSHERAIRHEVAPTSQPSPEINRVSCSSSFNNSFYDLRNIPDGGTVPVCFANAGNTGPIDVQCVSEVDTGNNTGSFSINNAAGTIFQFITPTKFQPIMASGPALRGCKANEFDRVVDVDIN